MIRPSASGADTMRKTADAANHDILLRNEAILVKGTNLLRKTFIQALLKRYL
jgi:hypothetical protein